MDPKDKKTGESQVPEEAQSTDKAKPDLTASIREMLQPRVSNTPEEKPKDEPEKKEEPKGTKDPEPDPAHKTPGEEEKDPPQDQVPKGAQHRIDKLTAKLKATEEELRNLREQRHERKRSDGAQGIKGMIEEAATPDQLDDLEQNALDTEKWAKTTLRRYRRDPEKVEREIQNRLGQVPDDPEEWLENLVDEAEFSRSRDIPKRRKALEQVAIARRAAVKEFPWLDDPTDERAALVEQAKQSRPWLRTDPEADYMLALALMGRQALEAQKAQKAKPKSKTPDPTPQPSTPSRSVPAMPESVEKWSKAKEAAIKDGSRDGLKEFIKSGVLKRTG